MPHTQLLGGRGAGGVICWGPCTPSVVEVPACQAVSLGEKFTAEGMQEAKVKLSQERWFRARSDPQHCSGRARTQQSLQNKLEH